MHALYSLAKEQRAVERESRTRAAASAWLAKQGISYGFDIDVDNLSIDGHNQVRVARSRGRPITFSVLEFEGILTIREPKLFLQRIAAGFGAARAFGCGLMLIGRAAVRISAA
jgi:CRISPR system Cascade subunit CasE